MPVPNVVISPRGEERLRSRHPWIYRSDLVEAEASAGDRVVVRSRRGRTLGHALYSDRSQIALRMMTDGDAPADDALIVDRIESAIAFRETLAIDATAYRLVHGEADRLPSLIVDRYGDYLVVQLMSQGMDRLTPFIVSVLEERLRPRGILARNDPRARLLEGLDQRVDVLAGDVPDTVEVHERGIRYEVDLRRGQKTGLFLDQRENRAAAVDYAHGRLLDCFSYHGGFALALADRCRESTAIDVSPDAIARLGANATRNGRSIDARAGNVFDELRAFERAGDRFDTIVLDPPAFAKNKAAVEKAIGGYKDINLRALRLLNPNGILITCSCSYHVSEAALAEVVYDAAIDAGVHVAVVEKRMQGRDHPVLLGVPETYYLKCFVLRKLS
jgi:23S rRNA (cytosine1962-C5)-methyltransferase